MVNKRLLGTLSLTLSLACLAVTALWTGLSASSYGADSSARPEARRTVPIADPAYLSPRPNSSLHSPRTTIAVRWGPAIDASSLHPDTFQVAGSQSGAHEGSALLAGDGLTVIFRSDRPFEPGEEVNVQIDDSLRTAQGGVLGALSYDFHVSPKALDDYGPARARNTESPHVAEAGAGRALPTDGTVWPPSDWLTLPADYPRVTVTVPASGTGEGFLFLANMFIRPPNPYLLIVDDRGDPIFHQRGADGLRLVDFKKQPNGMLTYYDPVSDVYTMLNQQYEVVRTYDAGNGYAIDFHGLHVREDGHVLLQIYDDQPVDMSQVVAGGLVTATATGAIVQELDPAGNVIFQWRSWDHIPITDVSDNIDLTGENPDITHINSVEWDNDGHILISNRHLDEVTKIDRQTADVIWRFGGKGNEFTITNDSRPFSHQHDARRLDNGNLLLYDNGNSNDPQYSRAVEYALDEENLLATRVWEYRNQPEDIYAFATGAAQRLQNENTLITWGGLGLQGVRPVLTEVMTDGTKALEMWFTDNASSYRVFRDQWEATPHWPPDLVLHQNDGTNLLAYSWNGATNVDHYLVYGGSGLVPDTLLDNRGKEVFETQSQFAAPQQHCYFYQVIPVDDEDRQQRQSNLVFAGDESCPQVTPLGPETGASHTYPSSRSALTVSVQAASNVVDRSILLLFNDLLSPRQAPPQGWRDGDLQFRLSPLENGIPVGQIQLDGPVTLTLAYSDGALPGVPEESLGLHRWDQTAGAWTQEGITLLSRDLNRNLIQVRIAHLSLFGLFGQSDRIDLIQDGGFEAGSSSPYWEQSSNNLPNLICGTNCSYDNYPQSHTGRFWVFFGGGIMQPEVASVSQTIQMPEGQLISGTLSFWLRIPQASANATDRFFITIDDTEIFSATAAEQAQYAQYTRVTVDVTTRLSGSHDIRFGAVLASNSLTSIYLDDISLQVEGSFSSTEWLYLPRIERAPSQARQSSPQLGRVELRPAESTVTGPYRTGPPDLPPLTVTLATSQTSDGFIFIAPYERRAGATPYGPYLLIVDNQGELIYYRSLPAPAEDFKKISEDLLSFAGGGQTHHRILSQNYKLVDTVGASAPFRADFHDFQLLPNGNRLLLIYEERRMDLSRVTPEGRSDATVVGCRIEEQTPDNKTIFSWTSFDHFALTDTTVSLATQRVDYVHCNAVEKDRDGHLLLSSRDMDEVTKIDRETGEILWRLGGKRNQFAFVNAIGAEDVAFVKQHDIRRVGNGNVTLFDNRMGADHYSRAVEYTLNEQDLVATLVWEERNQPDIQATIMANAQRLPNGNTLIGWGSGHPAVTEVRRDGAKVFELQLPISMQSYRAFRFPWQGHPQQPPALVVDRHTHTTTLYYSWNGATEVAAYRIYGDTSDYPRRLLRVEPRRGFETSSEFSNALWQPQSNAVSFRVVPVDATGAPLIVDRVVDLHGSTLSSVQDAISLQGGHPQFVTYTLRLANSGRQKAVTATVAAPLPSASGVTVRLLGAPLCSGDACASSPVSEDSGVTDVVWRGELPAGAEVHLTYRVEIRAHPPFQSAVELVAHATTTAEDAFGNRTEKPLMHRLAVTQMQVRRTTLPFVAAE